MSINLSPNRSKINIYSLVAVRFYSILMTIRGLTLSLSVIWLASCGSPVQLDNFDADQWKMDLNGCKAIRQGSVKSLWGQRDKLKGLSQTQVKKLLGKPDKHELYKRNQKFFVYYLDPSESCENAEPDLKVQILVIRFNALGNADEIILQME